MTNYLRNSLFLERFQITIMGKCILWKSNVFNSKVNDIVHGQKHKVSFGGLNVLRFRILRASLPILKLDNLNI